MKTTYDISSPSSENGSVHVTTRLKPLTSMTRLDGGRGSAVYEFYTSRDQDVNLNKHVDSLSKAKLFIKYIEGSVLPGTLLQKRRWYYAFTLNNYSVWWL